MGCPRDPSGRIAGRGVFATASVAKGSWLCEYKAGLVYPASERKKYEEIYDLNGDMQLVCFPYSYPRTGIEVVDCLVLPNLPLFLNVNLTTTITLLIVNWYLLCFEPFA